MVVQPGKYVDDNGGLWWLEKIIAMDSLVSSFVYFEVEKVLPANTRHRPNVEPRPNVEQMLGHRLRRWPNIG